MAAKVHKYIIFKSSCEIEDYFRAFIVQLVCIGNFISPSNKEKSKGNSDNIGTMIWSKTPITHYSWMQLG